MKPVSQRVTASKILVVDDSEEIVTLVTEILQDSGYKTIVARNGKEALKMVELENPDLILLDAMMPAMDGYEVTHLLKSQDRTRLTPIIMLTGLSDFNDKMKGIELGVDDFIVKPFNHIELLTRVKSLLRVKQYTDELENAETVIFSLALAVEAKDSYTEGHCHRLSYYGAKLAEHIGLSEDEIKAVRRGGVLHDIGKIAIDERILRKPGSLTSEEFTLVKQHPVIGENICKPLRSLNNVLPIIRSHQERWNGSGYPDGLSKENIPVTARVIMTVDLYDALTTDRPYRKALPEDEAFRIMFEEAEKGLWDPKMMQEFVQLIKNNKIEKLASPQNL
ncbi:response regulator [bacterium]|nr:response regulator [bacterium]